VAAQEEAIDGPVLVGPARQRLVRLALSSQLAEVADEGRRAGAPQAAVPPAGDWVEAVEEEQGKQHCQAAAAVDSTLQHGCAARKAQGWLLGLLSMQEEQPQPLLGQPSNQGEGSRP
jgi:hypothetical protein